MAIEEIEKLPGDRKCFRLVGQALVQHSISTVKPSIKDHRDQVRLFIQKHYFNQISFQKS